MSGIKPWARGPFDLLVHAERHLRDGGDFDRRVAFIGFDNAVEVAITCYLTLNPLQRGGRTYRREAVEAWLENYHTKVDFLFDEAGLRSSQPECDRADLVWYHDVRNGQYHQGGGTVPQMADLMGVRKAALWVFALLFEVPDAEAAIDARLAELSNSDLPQRTDEYDKLIDEAHGNVEIAGQIYSTSEALFSIDPVAYSELGGDLKQGDREAEAPSAETA